MPEISPKIHFYDKAKLEKINPETLKLWNKYKIDMSLRELSDRTVSGYENDISHWFIYIYDNQGNQCITDLDEDDITEFLAYCKQGGNNSRRMKRRMASISAFYKFLHKKRIIKENPMDFISRPQKDIDVLKQTFLTQAQVNLMRKKLEENGNILLQTYAMFSLSTMARVHAVANLKWEQVDFESRTCEDVLEKEEKHVTLYFSKEVKNLLIKLKQYYVDNNIENNGYVFVNKNTGEPMTTSTLDAWCKVIGNMIGVPTLHAHDFRHSGSQLMKLQGANIETISSLLNHSGLDVTRKFYLRPDKAKIQAEKDKFSF
ncbi:Site-specific recombinase XerD [Ruminococcaceae bacterium BL-6]|nr:Site-specific recombinase XerD [Ruminococcaceae bacterium BL-6]